MSAVKNKYRVYLEYRKKRLALDDFGFEFFSVLFLTDAGEQRALNTNREMQNVFPNCRSWLFSHKQHMLDTSAHVLTASWARGDGEPEFLIRIETKPQVPHPVN